MKKLFDLVLIAFVLFTVIITQNAKMRFIGSLILITLLIFRYFMDIKEADASKRNLYLLAAILYGIWAVIQGFWLFI